MPLVASSPARGGLLKSVVRNPRLSLHDNLFRVRVEDEVGDARAVLAAHVYGGVQSAPYIAVGVCNLLHTRVVGVQAAVWRAKGRVVVASYSRDGCVAIGGNKRVCDALP